MSFSSTSSIHFLDSNTCLPDRLFSRPIDAACTVIIQDAKVNFTKLTQQVADSVITCEFGTVGSVSWRVDVWGERQSRPLNRVVQILNKEGLPVWLQSNPEYIINEEKRLAESATWIKVQRALGYNMMNIPAMDSSSLQKKLSQLSTLTEPDQFNPTQLNTYQAVVMTPDAEPTDLVAASRHVLPLDGGRVGPVDKILRYKHLTRLALNGTDGAAQNPDYVMIECFYQPGLATFLKARFAADDRLVLKHVDSSHGDGVVILDATTIDSLDSALSTHLDAASSFKRVSPLSICIIEKFISNAEPTEIPQQAAESVVRVVYLALQEQEKLKLHMIDGVKATEDVSSHETASSRGLVKLTKWHDGKIKLLGDEELRAIGNCAVKHISTIADRALRYDAAAAVQYFLSSDNFLLNLVGIELFYPFHTCSYREEMGNGLRRISSEQCKLLLALLERNDHPRLVNALLRNVLYDVFQTKKGLQLVPEFADLLAKICQLSSSNSVDFTREVTAQLESLPLFFSKEIEQKWLEPLRTLLKESIPTI